MNTPLFIAQRYLLSKKSHNLINIITAITMLGIGVASFALIVILSAFNGLEETISSMNAKLTPDFLIEPVEGKTISLETFPLDSINNANGIGLAIPSLHEDALFRSGDRQYLGKIRGISSEINTIDKFGETIISGSFDIDNAAVTGAGVAWHLDINVDDPIASIRVYVPQHGTTSSSNIENGFKSEVIHVSGIFYTSQESDETTIFTDFNTLARLMNMQNKANSIEIYAEQGTNIRKLKKKISHIVGENFTIKDKYEQQATLYHIMRSEKWAVYLVLAFILVLSTFNVAGSLSMLIIDKKKDIEIFKAMGGDKQFTRKVFLSEGLLIALTGGILGLIAGILTIWLQQQFGFVKFGSSEGTYIIDTYPVALRISDIIAILATLLSVGLCSSALTVKISLRKLSKGN